MGIPIWRPRRRAPGWKRHRDGSAVPLSCGSADHSVRAMVHTIQELHSELVRSRRNRVEGLANEAQEIDLRRFRAVLAEARSEMLEGEREDTMTLAPPIDDCAEDERDPSMLSAYPPRSLFGGEHEPRSWRLNAIGDASPRTEYERFRRNYVYTLRTREPPLWRRLNEPRPRRSSARGIPSREWGPGSGSGPVTRHPYVRMLRTMGHSAALYNDSDSSDDEH